MGADQQFCLRWNNFHTNITSAFESLRDDEDFVDITLACEGRQVKAHKMVLSACSPYFRSLLRGNPCQHPIVFLKDVTFANLSSILDFMYHGEVNVSHNELATFLKTAEALKVRGLAEDEKKKDTESCNESSSPPPPREPPDPGSPRPEESNTVDTHLSDSPPPAKRQRRRSGASVQSAEDTNETVLSDVRECTSVKNEPQDFNEDEDLISHSLETSDVIKTDLHSEDNCDERSFGPSDSVTISRSQAAMQQLQESFGSFIPGMGQSPGFLSHGASDMSRPPQFSMEGVQGLPPGISTLPGPSMSQGAASQDSSQGQGGGEEGHVCRFCGRVCSSRYNLKKHERDLHLNRGAKFTCELCKRQYGSLNSLQVHCSNSHPTGVVRRRHSLNSTTYHLSNQQPKSRPNTDDESSQSPQKQSNSSSLNISTKQESPNPLLSPPIPNTSHQSKSNTQTRMLSPTHQSLRPSQISQSRLHSPQHYIDSQSTSSNIKLPSPVIQQHNRVHSPILQPSISPQQKINSNIIDQNLTAKLQDHIQKASLQYPAMQSTYLVQPQPSPQIQTAYNLNHQLQPRRYPSPVSSTETQLPTMFPFHAQHFLDLGARALGKGDTLPPMPLGSLSDGLTADALHGHALTQGEALNSEDREALEDAAVLSKNLMFS